MNIFGFRLICCAAAGVLDQLFADPRVLHPICLIGRLIGWVQRWTRPLFPKTKGGERAAGVYLVVFVLLVVVAAVCAVTVGAYRIHPACGVAVESVLIFYALAEKSLERESCAVYRALNTEGLERARHAVSMIVGRDTESLSEEGVIKATVETVAENTSDGVVAPLLFAFLGGAPLAYFYKAVNTMDSMVGYRNEVYQYYGTAAARLDDALNFIPARLSAFCMLLALALAKPAAGIRRKRKCRDKGDGQISGSFGRAQGQKTQEQKAQDISAGARRRGDEKGGQVSGFSGRAQDILNGVRQRNLYGISGEWQKQGMRDIFRIYRKYRRCHASPNSAQTESVMAGALGVELAGPARYFGELHIKPVIGESTRAVERADILRSVSILRGTAYLFWFCGLVILEALWLFS